MPTAYGSPIHAGHRPTVDAASVAIARRSGMLPLGKLVTTEFAAWPPGPTVNPHDVTRTPGGSSSGSAAAVAAGMVPVAFATQTTGSIIRPAAFCGVVGYKPATGTLPTSGVKAISESFDTVGVIARTVADAAFVVGALCGRPLEPPPEPSAPRLGDLPDTRVAESVVRDRGAVRRAPRAARAGRRSIDRGRAPGGVRRACGGAGHDLDVRDRPVPGRRAPALPRADPRAAARDARRRDSDARLRVRRGPPTSARVRHWTWRSVRRRRRIACPGRARRGARGRHDRRPDLQSGMVCARWSPAPMPGRRAAPRVRSRRRPGPTHASRGVDTRRQRWTTHAANCTTAGGTESHRLASAAGVVTSGRVPPHAPPVTPSICLRVQFACSAEGNTPRRAAIRTRRTCHRAPSVRAASDDLAPGSRPRAGSTSIRPGTRSDFRG